MMAGMSRRDRGHQYSSVSTTSRALLFAQALAMLGAGCRTSRSTGSAQSSRDDGIAANGAVEDTGARAEELDSGSIVALEDSASREDTTGLRSDLCPEMEPSRGSACAPRRYCIYPQHAMQGTSCRCLDREEARNNGIAPRQWNCRPYEFVGVGPLSPSELDERDHCVIGATYASCSPTWYVTTTSRREAPPTEANAK